jgi:hypothetical protein
MVLNCLFFFLFLLERTESTLAGLGLGLGLTPTPESIDSRRSTLRQSFLVLTMSIFELMINERLIMP